MSNQRVTVRLDDRVRLMSAMLAMTDWPVREQKGQPHGVHPHAKATRKYLAPFADHPAVKQLQELLDAGQPLEDVFAFSQALSWPSLRARGADLPDWLPSGWSAQIRNFYIATKLANFWKDERNAWEEAVGQLDKIFERGAILAFLTPYLGKIERTLIFLPNLSFPTTGTVCFAAGDEVYCLAAPRLAVGSSPPWPYQSDPGWVYLTAFQAFTRLLVLDYLKEHKEAARSLGEETLPVPDAFRQANPDWRDQFTKIFVGAATAIYLEETSGKEEADAYIMVEHKAQDFNILPSAVSVLRRYLREREGGRYDELADYLPYFRNNLRVATKLLT